jgi:hypothetical protein
MIICVLVALLTLSKNHYGFSKDWSLFFLFSLGYIVIVTKGCLSALRRLQQKLLGYAILFSVLIAVVATFAMLFYFGVFPFPRRNIWPWGIGTTALAFITVVIYVESIKKIDGNARR